MGCRERPRHRGWGRATVMDCCPLQQLGHELITTAAVLIHHRVDRFRWAPLADFDHRERIDQLSRCWLHSNGLADNGSAARREDGVHGPAYPPTLATRYAQCERNIDDQCAGAQWAADAKVEASAEANEGSAVRAVEPS